jgi:demethylmenaquinone methyltransferase/2-methoxy-6-polyprenyl-1,4-benzoquinol methylase
MFSTVAETYDLANKILTIGLDKHWRKTCAKNLTNPKTVLDLCCGTGDLSLQLLQNLSPDAQLIGLDFSKQMLKKAVAKKTKNKPTTKNLTFIIADAAHLPIKNETIDDIHIAFSFRNLIYKNPKANTYLKEVTRTLKSNGKFTCIETSQPKNTLTKTTFHLYCQKIIPHIGGIISHQKPAYTYLGKSAANFPPPQKITTLMKNAGLQKTTHKPLLLGTIALYTATK